ncbi:hypothetical protein CEXT_159571 [Caerostris extrusa]|uniref:Uncharacterized protein n=1 Tax=Caerostris extrusa TaxID=172846 RepID=A0AAV4T466_CAEEX|nr:hypothetical protein CEXT_159571 [Caerostris extrusa]
MSCGQPPKKMFSLEVYSLSTSCANSSTFCQRSIGSAFKLGRVFFVRKDRHMLPEEAPGRPQRCYWRRAARSDGAADDDGQ